MNKEVKALFRKLPDKRFAITRLEKAVKPIESAEQFRRKNYGKYAVLICGDHKGKSINLKFLRRLQKKLTLKYGVTCYIGRDFIRRVGKARHKDIQKAYLENADIIIFIDGKSTGTNNESNEIRRNKKLKKKTIAFFKYKTYSELIRIPDNEDYLSEFKYPIPYRNMQELEAKVIFGTKHAILYLLDKDYIKRHKNKSNKGNFKYLKSFKLNKGR